MHIIAHFCKYYWEQLRHDTPFKTIANDLYTKTCHRTKTIHLWKARAASILPTVVKKWTYIVTGELFRKLTILPASHYLCSSIRIQWNLCYASTEVCLHDYTHYFLSLLSTTWMHDIVGLSECTCRMWTSFMDMTVIIEKTYWMWVHCRIWGLEQKGVLEYQVTYHTYIAARDDCHTHWALNLYVVSRTKLPFFIQKFFAICQLHHAHMRKATRLFPLSCTASDKKLSGAWEQDTKLLHWH